MIESKVYSEAGSNTDDHGMETVQLVLPPCAELTQHTQHRAQAYTYLAKEMKMSTYMLQLGSFPELTIHQTCILVTLETDQYKNFTIGPTSHNTQGPTHSTHQHSIQHMLIHSTYLVKEMKTSTYMLQLSSLLLLCHDFQIFVQIL